MFKSPFPPQIEFLGYDQNGISGTIHTSEELLITNSSADRQQEFRAGRLLANQLLKKFSVNSPVLSNSDGSPSWPVGFCGSITHKDSWVFCAIAQTNLVRSVGLDLERVSAKKTIVKRIAHEQEIEWINERGADPILRQQILFSAKESLFKCLYPLSRSFFGFKDALLTPIYSLGEPITISGFSALLMKNLNEEFTKGFKLKIGVVKGTDYILTHTFLKSVS